MKLKYYLRGLGLGILVTALILGIAGGSGQSTLSDEEIRARAKELGMVDGSNLTLSQVQSAPDAQKESEELPDETKEPEKLQEETQATEEQAEETQATEEQAEETQATEEQAEETKESEKVAEETSEVAETPTASETTESSTVESSETVTFVIKGGASSDAVSRNLVTAGLVENAKEYDAYLCNNGYSRSLRVGTFEIPVGSTWEEIAKIITGKR